MVILICTKPRKISQSLWYLPIVSFFKFAKDTKNLLNAKQITTEITSLLKKIKYLDGCYERDINQKLAVNLNLTKDEATLLQEIVRFKLFLPGDKKEDLTQFKNFIEAKMKKKTKITEGEIHIRQPKNDDEKSWAFLLRDEKFKAEKYVSMMESSMHKFFIQKAIMEDLPQVILQLSVLGNEGRTKESDTTIWIGLFLNLFSTIMNFSNAYLHVPYKLEKTDRRGTNYTTNQSTN